MENSILIPVFTAIITIIASLIATHLKNKSELKKIYAGLEQKYAEALYNKRIDMYPGLYKILSSHTKLINEGKASLQTLRDFKTALDT